jgi:hypothetical protein
LPSAKLLDIRQPEGETVMATLTPSKATGLTWDVWVLIVAVLLLLATMTALYVR